MRQPQSIRLHLAAVFLLVLCAGGRARLVQHLAASQFRCAVGRRRRDLAADHARAWRSQQLHVGLPRHRGQRICCRRIRPRPPRPKSRWRNWTGRSPNPSASSSASATMRRKTTSMPSSRRAGTTIAASSIRCWCCRAAIARTRRCKSTAARRAPPITPRAIRSASLPIRLSPAPRSRAIASRWPIVRPSG